MPSSVATLATLATGIDRIISAQLYTTAVSTSSKAFYHSYPDLNFHPAVVFATLFLTILYVSSLPTTRSTPLCVHAINNNNANNLSGPLALLTQRNIPPPPFPPLRAVPATFSPLETAFGSTATVPRLSSRRSPRDSLCKCQS